MLSIVCGCQRYDLVDVTDGSRLELCVAEMGAIDEMDESSETGVAETRLSVQTRWVVLLTKYEVV